MTSQTDAPDGDKASFSLAAGQGYLLSREHAAAVRLNYQHYLWKDALGFTLHPSIPRPGAEAAVADVAAGTGMWLLDLSRQLPDTNELHGYDLVLSNAPVAAWLPRNVSFKHWDIYSTVPEDAVGRYDVVHVRLLILAIDGEAQTRSVIRNLLRMLKPGGYLQWDEIDNTGACIRRPDHAAAGGMPVPTPGLDALYEKARAGGRFDWAARLDEFLAEEGFEDVQATKYGDRDDLARAFNDHHLMLMEEFAGGLARIGKVQAADEFLHDIRLAYGESTKGPVICFPRVVAVARKPPV